MQHHIYIYKCIYDVAYLSGGGLCKKLKHEIWIFIQKDNTRNKNTRYEMDAVKNITL